MSNMFTQQMLNLNSYKKILNSIEDKITPISTHGLSEENVIHLAYTLNKHLNRQIVIITYDELKAKKMKENLNLFGNDISEFLPSRQMLFYDIDAYSRDIYNQRIKVIDRLINNEPVIVVSSIEAVLNKMLPKETMLDNIFDIKFGSEIDLDKVIKTLNNQGYERVEIIEGKGQFSVRGGIIDIFPVNIENPFRIELFDNEVDSIRSFDITTQRSIENLSKVEIPPVKEIIVDELLKEDIIKNINKDLKSTIRKFKDTDKSITEKINEKFKHIIDKLENNIAIENLELLISYISNCKETILSYFNKDSIILIDEPTRIDENVKYLYDNFNDRYIDLYLKGEVLNKQRDILYNYEELVDEIKRFITITTTGLLKNNQKYKPKTIINIVSKGTQSYHNKLKLLSEDLKDYKYRGYKVIILCGTDERGLRLQENLKELDVECSFIKDYGRDIMSGQVYIVPGTISRGFEYPDIKFIIISDHEVFGSSKRKRSKKAKKDSRKINSFTDLKVGDFVVHETHGIGKYIGIEQLSVQDIKKDYLSISYKGEDKLYIPVDQMDLIQRYIGADAVKPKINKLGSGDWVKTKAKVKKAIEDMAEELIELYAKRYTAKGYQFTKDQPWQKQFEDIFPYEETEDQIKSISEIKSDMEKEKPMDRLLCGDVGYGKTEVALRAAFKATLDSKQVAFLVPTTILAQQHYNTIMERFSDFPVNVEMLSRFRTPARQKKIINDIKAGNLDIVVGTHRLLSKDIKFKDLGLLVVDEEQRFGVKHKEALKKIKESVDVLTLTATPIPRTLHMSLVGIRDMSVLEEPPEERYPIQTYVLEYNEQLIRDAIIKELRRDGQVYFVFNRVQGIKKMASILKELVPEARIVVGHGQMSERELEKVMLDFMNQEYDILVSTTIIETGLDIPNVNTMIIHDADKMGLSQLYQLRGRVGRSNRIAYAYFMYEKDKVLTEIAEKRLKAIKEFTEFGSGFKIAMRDLEIRGAGNLLGSSQHGHMAAIGYDLYVKYLEDTVKKLKGEVHEEEVETTIDLKINAYIPNRYIRNEKQKIEMYKRISAIENDDDMNDVTEELLDRFGDIPKATDNLMKIVKIKSICNKLKITSITQKAKNIIIEYSNIKYMTPELINELCNSFGMRMTFDVSQTPSLKYLIRKSDENTILKDVESIIGKIRSVKKQKIEL